MQRNSKQSKGKYISNELADFLNLDRYCQINSLQIYDVTSKVQKYIRDNKLNNLRTAEILVDDKLSTFIKLKPNEKLTHFNIDKHISLNLFDTLQPQKLTGDISMSPPKVPSNLLKKDSSDDDSSDNDSSDDESSDAILPEPPRVPIENINLCFVGGVSTGKSTVLNAIFCEELTQCKIKRTTMVPTIYVENENDAPNLTAPDMIFKTISNKNNDIILKTETGKKLDKSEYKELAFNVGKLDINILQGSYVNVYDIPGLNDARTKDTYYTYLDDNFTKFNLVILLVDIHSGLNTSDEIDIVNFITTHTKYEMETNNKQIYTLVVVNKADDMQLDDEGDEETLKLTGELSEMYEQVEKTITTEFNRHNIINQLIGIIPLCAIDSYLYRMVKNHGKKFKLSPEQILKIGINENGKKFSTLKPATQEKKVYEILTDENFINTMIKLSGFSQLENILHKFLNKNNVGKQIRIDNLLFEMSKYTNIYDVVVNNSKNFVEIEKAMKKYNSILETIKKIDYDAYSVNILQHLDKFNLAVKELTSLVRSNKKLELVEYYDKMYKQIIQPYFGEFVSPEYPEYVKDHLLVLIKDDFDNKRIQIQNIVTNCNILKKINMFVPSAVESIFNTIIKNTYQKSTLFTNDMCEYIELISLFQDCDSLNINISHFMRFVLINLYYEISVQGSLYKRQMLFKRYGEIPMYTFITNLLVRNTAMDDFSMNIFVCGMTQEDYNCDEFVLENYYIQYEKAHNSGNFTL